MSRWFDGLPEVHEALVPLNLWGSILIRKLIIFSCF